MSEMEQHTGLDGDLPTSQNETEGRPENSVTTEGKSFGGGCIKRTAKQPQCVWGATMPAHPRFGNFGVSSQEDGFQSKPGRQWSLSRRSYHELQGRIRARCRPRGREVSKSYEARVPKCHPRARN